MLSLLTGGPAITIVKICKDNEIFSVASDSDLNTLAPKSWLVGQTWNWGPLYVKIAQSVIDHTWRSANSIYGMKMVMYVFPLLVQ